MISDSLYAKYILEREGAEVIENEIGFSVVACDEKVILIIKKLNGGA